jgi:hypothetical protein
MPFKGEFFTGQSELKVVKEEPKIKQKIAFIDDDEDD